jgi:Na+/phosphate symporter
MIAGLLGGLALFLYGMDKLTAGLKAAAGNQMKLLLARLTRNRVLGAITGAFVTAVIQSSSVTTVLVVGFVSAGDERAAQQVLAQHDRFWSLCGQLLSRGAAQLAQDDPNRLVKHRLQVDLIDKLRRIYSLSEQMAVSVLPRGALVGERGSWSAGE